MTVTRARKSSPRAQAIKTSLLDGAYLVLDVKKQDVDAASKISHLLRESDVLDRVFEYLEGSEEPEAKKILEARRRVSGSLAALLPFEAYCVAAGVTTKKAFAVISGEVMDQSAKASALLARSKHPEVVAYTIDQALTPAGSQERKMLHQSAGFLPMPKGNVNVFGGLSVDNRVQTQNVAVLPPVEDAVKRMADRFGEMPTVAAPMAEIEEISDEEGEE